jgi:hypothetical protein
MCIHLTARMCFNAGGSNLATPPFLKEARLSFSSAASSPYFPASIPSTQSRASASVLTIW